MYLLVKPQAPSPQKGETMKFYQDNKSKQYVKYENDGGLVQLVSCDGVTVTSGDTSVISTGLRVKLEGHTAVPISVIPPLSIVRIFVKDNGELCLVVYNHSRGHIVLEGGATVAMVTFVKSATLTRVNTVKDLME